MKNLFMAIMVAAGLTATANAFNEAGCVRVGQELKMEIGALEKDLAKEKKAEKKVEVSKKIDALKAKEAEAKKALKDKKYKECVAIKKK